MSHVGRERRNHSTHICPVLEPCCQSVDREGISQVLHPRLVTCSVIAGNAGFLAYFLEGLACRARFDLRSILGQKELRRAYRLLLASWSGLFLRFGEPGQALFKQPNRQKIEGSIWRFTADNHEAVLVGSR